MGAMRTKICVWMIGAFFLPLLLQAQAASGGDHWVATWATSQQLMTNAPMGGRGGGRGGPGRGPGPAAAAPGAAQQSSAAAPAVTPPAPGRGGRPIPANLPTTFSDQTVRMVVRTG